MQSSYARLAPATLESTVLWAAVPSQAARLGQLASSMMLRLLLLAISTLADASRGEHYLTLKLGSMVANFLQLQSEPTILRYYYEHRERAVHSVVRLEGDHEDDFLHKHRHRPCSWQRCCNVDRSKDYLLQLNDQSIHSNCHRLPCDKHIFEQ